MEPMDRRPTVLLTESDVFIGTDVSDALVEAGFRVLGPINTMAEALDLLERERPSLAIIEIVLKDGSCTDLTRALRRHGVPFLVHSPGPHDPRLIEDLQGVPWLSKAALTMDAVAILNELSSATPAPRGMAVIGAVTTPIVPLRPVRSATNPLVRKLEGFAVLSDADRAMLERISAKPRQVTSGTDLVREGDAPEGVFLVMEGMACRYKLRTNGARQIMAYLVPGDMCDLDVVLLSEMDHAIGTLSVCKVVQLLPGTISDLLEHHPQIALALRKAQLVDEATLREWLLNVGRRTARERIAHIFCELLARLQAVGLTTDDAYALPLTQTDLADTAGLSTVHVNRSLKDLRQLGLIKLKTRWLTILDLPRLKEVAEFRPGYLHLGEQAAA